ncbi:Lipase [Porphyridium purpureum]|uniref:Lipase n=1 Tax=Porphyridium purpureum TaxID=35688 RepID=A0A5J4Z503_PORPP|nr:Lipase [Porphyridium purpureum]|eukprot:POR5623..scf295_1
MEPHEVVSARVSRHSESNLFHAEKSEGDVLSAAADSKHVDRESKFMSKPSPEKENNSQLMGYKHEISKIEVATSKQIRWMLRLMTVAVAIAILFAILDVYVITTSTVDTGGIFFCKNIILDPSNLDWQSNCDAANLVSRSLASELASCILITILFFFQTFFCFEFFRMVRRSHIPLQHEHIWCAKLLIYFCLADIPIADWIFYAENVGGNINAQVGANIQSIFTAIFQEDIFSLVYIWGMSEVFRMPKHRKPHWVDFCPHVTALACFTAIRALLLYYADTLSPSSVTGLLSGIVADSSAVSTPAQQGFVAINLIFTLFLFLFAFAQIWITVRHLRKLDYITSRSRQIAFRFFLIHTMYLISWTFIMGLINGLAQGQDNQRILSKNFGVYSLGWYGNIGVDLLSLTYVVQEAWANLPARAELLSDYLWFTCPDPRDDGARRVEYFLDRSSAKFRTSSSSSHASSRIPYSSRAFVLEDVLSMFNMAWIAFSYGRTGKTPRIPADFGEHETELIQHVSDESTDTHAIVFATPTRIILSFRGTMSTKNMVTDISFAVADFQHGDYELEQSLTEQVMDDEFSYLGMSDEKAPPSASQNKNISAAARSASSFRLQYKSGSRGTDSQFLSSSPEPLQTWRFTRKIGVHSGFAKAYLSIAEQLVEVVCELYRQKKRSVWLTGHSLGGALATLCSYDLLHALKLSRDEVAVYTFGSPRVGNYAFVDAYNRQIPRHWRVVFASDLVTTVPTKFLYGHVGTEALLTKRGLLFLDPTSVEFMLWHTVGSLKDHEKRRYMEALRMWCNFRHPSLAVHFWLETASLQKNKTKKYWTQRFKSWSLRLQKEKSDTLESSDDEAEVEPVSATFRASI